MNKMEIWGKVKEGSRVMWLTATGENLPATVIQFTSPTSYIRIQTDDGQECSIWIESIVNILE